MHSEDVFRSHSCTLKMLMPNDTESSQFRFPILLGSCPLPPAPPFVRVRGKDFVTLAWYTPLASKVADRNSPILRYEVSLCGDANSVPSAWLPCYEGRNEMCTISGLTPGRQYRARVLALNVAGASRFSGESFFCTAPGQPGAPAAPSATTITSSSVDLKWSPPEYQGGSSVSGYRLEMRRVNTRPSRVDESVGKEYQLVYEGRQSQFSKRDLCAGSSYEFRVLAVNKIGKGIWSAPSRVATDRQAVAKQSPDSLDMDPSGLRASRVLCHNTSTLQFPKSEMTNGDNGDLSPDVRKESDSPTRCKQSDSPTRSAWVDACNGSDLEHEATSSEPNRRYYFRAGTRTERGTLRPIAAKHRIPYLSTVSANAQKLPCRFSARTDSHLVIPTLSPPQPAAPELILSATSVSVFWRAEDNGGTMGTMGVVVEEDARARNVTHELEMSVPALGKSAVIYSGRESWHEVKDIAPGCVHRFRVRFTSLTGPASSDWSPSSEICVPSVRAFSAVIRRVVPILGFHPWNFRLSPVIISLGILFLLVATICIRWRKEFNFILVASRTQS